MHKSLNLSKQLINFIRKFEIKQSYSEKKETSSKSVKTINPRNSEKKTVYKKMNPNWLLRNHCSSTPAFIRNEKNTLFITLTHQLFRFDQTNLALAVISVLLFSALPSLKTLQKQKGTLKTLQKQKGTSSKQIGIPHPSNTGI